MSREAIIEYLGEDWKEMVGLISSSLGSDVSLLQKVNEDVLSHSGKMLRPMMTLLMAKACGILTKDSIRYAAAAEMLHNATLMHDDVADESVERRGVPTVSSTVGPNAAVLIGDYWLSKAVEIVLMASGHEEVIGYFSKTLTDLAEGEMLQLQKSGTGDTTEEDYKRIIYSKTASLFEAALVSGAVSAGASREYKEVAAKYAQAIGMAFQIKDDILDYVGDTKVGKPVGVDLKEQKITLPLLGAISGSSRESEIRRMVCEIHSHPEHIKEITAFVLASGGVEYASGKLSEYVELAKEVLSPLPDSQAKEFLKQLAEYNIFRER